MHEILQKFNFLWRSNPLTGVERLRDEIVDFMVLRVISQEILVLLDKNWAILIVRLIVFRDSLRKSVRRDSFRAEKKRSRRSESACKSLGEFHPEPGSKHTSVRSSDHNYWPVLNV